MSVPLEGAHLAGLFTSCVLYGLFILMYAELIWQWWKDARPVPRFLLLSTTALFISLTLFAGISINFVYDGFVTYRETMSITEYFGQVSAWQEIAANLLLEFNTALSDGILIYRCWLIWDRSKLIGVTTLVLYAGFIVVSGFNLAALTTEGNSTDLLGFLFQHSVSTWMRTYLSYTLGQSAIVYGLIIFRIWHTSRKITRRSSSMSPVIKRLLAVGLCYVVVLAFWLIMNILGSTIYLIVVYVWIPFVGLVFLALSVRSGAGSGSGQASEGSRVTYATERHRSNAVPLTPIRISVTQQAEADAEWGISADGKQDNNDRTSTFTVDAL